MTTVWFTGNLHLGHARAAACRGFDKPEDHDRALCERWREIVGAEDIVWIIGNISVGSPRAERYALRILKSLPGRKRLITGKHDSVSGSHAGISPNTEFFRDVFEHIADVGRIRVHGESILLSSYPYTSDQADDCIPGSKAAQYQLPDLGTRLIHACRNEFGHCSPEQAERQYCISRNPLQRLIDLHDIEHWVLSNPGKDRHDDDIEPASDSDR